MTRYAIFGLATMFAISITVHAGEKQTPLAGTATYSVSVAGMTCETCAVHLREALSQVPGVVKSDINYKAGHVWVTVKPPATRTDRPAAVKVGRQLAAAVKKAGYKPTVNYLLAVRGMTCQACAGHIQQSLAGIPGVEAASVDYRGKYAIVQPAAGTRGLDNKLTAAVKAAGYEASVVTRP